MKSLTLQISRLIDQHDIKAACNLLIPALRDQPENPQLLMLKEFILLQYANKPGSPDSEIQQLSEVTSTPQKSTEPANRYAPLVSVITPTIRTNLLGRAVRSILAQTMPDFELIILDDSGKPELEGEYRRLIKEFNDERIIYLRHGHNKGLPAARNTALRQARGKYIAYLDDDDYYYPNHLEILTEFLENNSEYQVAYTDGLEAFQKLENGEWVNVRKQLEYSIDYTFAGSLVLNLFLPAGMMHARDCIYRTGLYDEGLHFHEDWDMWLRMGTVYPFYHIKRVTFEYTTRLDGSNARTGWNGNHLNTYFLLYKRFEKYAAQFPGLNQHQLERRRVIWNDSIQTITNVSPADWGKRIRLDTYAALSTTVF